MFLGTCGRRLTAALVVSFRFYKGLNSAVADLNAERRETLASKRDSGTGTNPGPCDAKVWSHCSEDPSGS